MNAGFAISICGEKLHLLPQKALWWPAASAVLVADTHFGKEATFRTRGIPIADYTLRSDLVRLADILQLTAARRLIVLGDLLHSRAGRSPKTLGEVTAWRRRYSAVECELVKGNHDRAAGPPPEEWNIRTRPDDDREGPFILAHAPNEQTSGFVIAGHLHPKVRLYEQGQPSLKFPCFWLRERVLVLPAFGSFIDSAPIAAKEGDRIFAIAGPSVQEIVPGSTRSAHRRS